MLSLSVLAVVAASLVSQSAGTVTTTTTVTQTSYLPLEQCCGQPTFSLGSMLPKPSSPVSQASDGQIQASVTPSEPAPAGSPSATLSAPSDVCTAGPSTLGADCSATGHCCAPVSCDSTTLICINPDEDTAPAPAAVAPAPAAPSTPSGGDDTCDGNPSTLGADCTATGQCCLPYSCDASSNTCIVPP